MLAINIDDFDEQKECFFEGERYSVRDNGAVLRHSRKDGRKRSADNEWTFGKENLNNPYLCISGVRIHRIVATAFHGEPPDSKYVVDHIDSNCRNNRPDNLRWFTRLENALKNPITRKKIKYLCGSIDAFLENPSMLNDISADPSFSWMRTVTRKEAQNCKLRMALWANIDSGENKSHKTINYQKSFNKRVLKPLQKWEAGLSGEPGLDFSLTPWCGQYMWGLEVYFPCCPHDFGNDPLDDYLQNIKQGKLFAYNDLNSFPRLIVFKAAIIKQDSSIVVICERADLFWSVIGILFNEKSHFIHFNLGSFNSLSEAEIVFLKNKSVNNFWSDGYGCYWDPK